jgi:hypothetical protein
MTGRTSDPRPADQPVVVLPLMERGPMTPKLAVSAFLHAALLHPDFGRCS